MVRINLIPPYQLSDQHLIAEYREILLLSGLYNKNKNKRYTPTSNNLLHPYRFFHDKLTYLEKRHSLLRQEMIDRNFCPTKTVTFSHFPLIQLNDFEPQSVHINLVKNRIIQRLHEKPTWYRYYGSYKDPEFFMTLMENQHETY